MNKKVEEWTVLSMLEWATDYFEQKNIPDPRHSIEWLLAETLSIKRLDLYLKFDRPLSAGELNRLRPMVKRRAKHEPLQYIIGFTDFMNARISVNEDVLIPRIETEQLVELILDRHPAAENPSASVLDIGTGSGCIPIALKMERPDWQVNALDISADALQVARTNAQQNGADITFFEGNIFSPASIEVASPLDLIISNPPYIEPDEEETLEPQVRDFEPYQALFTDDINKMYRSIEQFAQQYIAEDGSLYLELHEYFANKIQDIFEQKCWETKVLQDYDNNDRFLIARPQ